MSEASDDGKDSSWWSWLDWGSFRDHGALYEGWKGFIRILTAEDDLRGTWSSITRLPLHGGFTCVCNRGPHRGSRCAFLVIREGVAGVKAARMINLSTKGRAASEALCNS